MTAHVFPFDDWFMTKEGDWDCHFNYVVVEPTGQVRMLAAGNDLLAAQMRERYPDRLEHRWSLSRHRDKLEITPSTRQLERDHPRAWYSLNAWCPFGEKR